MTQTIKKTALVTGGHGFLGSHLVDLLLEKGFSVRCLVRPDREGDLFPDKDVQVVSGDLRHTKGLEDAVSGVDYVFHSAGLVAASGPSAYRAVNIDGTRRIATAVRAAAPECRRFVYVSSQAAAGPSRDGTAITENVDPHPITHYGRSKLRGEQVLPRALEGGPPFTILRPPAIYGPRDEALLPFFQAAARGFVPLPDGPDPRIFNLLHARDVAAGLLAGAISPAAEGGTYFLSDAVGTTYNNLAQALEEAFGSQLRKFRITNLLLDFAAIAADELSSLTGRISIFGRQKAREIKSRWWLCSSAAADRDLGWAPRIGLTEGVAETADWYRAAGLLRSPRRARVRYDAS